MARPLTQRHLLLAALLVAVVVVAFAYPHGTGRTPSSSIRAHARRPQPGRDTGEHPLDDLPARLDDDDPPAGLVHERAQGEADGLYGETGWLSDYQEDHLISLELGGNPTDPRNLWPEPYPRAAAVDQIENELNAEVCSGQLTLAQAQQREDDLKHRDG